MPSLLRPFISGIVEGVARESLERTLPAAGARGAASTRRDAPVIAGLDRHRRRLVPRSLAGQRADRVPARSASISEPTSPCRRDEDVPALRYLKRSSNAWRALAGAVVLVSRATVVRGSNSVQLLRASFGLMRAGIGF